MKRIVSVAAIFVAAFFAFYLLTSISEEDVFAYHQLDPPKSPEAVEAGDIVALSPDRLRSEKICDQNLAEPLIDRGEVRDVYFNSLWDRVADFSRLIRFEPGAETERRAISFRGEKSTIAESGSPLADMAQSCECNMAKALNSRRPVCTVRASLVEKRVVPGFQEGDPDRVSEVTVAYALSLFSNQVTEAQFEACGLEMSEAAVATMQMECTQNGLPYDTVIRQRLNLIERQPILQANLQ
ncbi:hypothetical protein [Dinoroseobacter sp. S76]|uniref:hypothetical protein n=1 Tax=Dinoroseobacter sp. S76 TaxID=3415124 RepID=UPI003C7A2C3D